MAKPHYITPGLSTEDAEQMIDALGGRLLSSWISPAGWEAANQADDVYAGQGE